MELPEPLRQAIERHAQDADQTLLTRDAQALSARYRTQTGGGKSLITNDTEPLAYALARMPATYGATHAALSHALAATEEKPETLLDAGAGTGAVSWAADQLLDLKEITCLERAQGMAALGMELMREGSPALQNARWMRHDLTAEVIPQRGDLVVASYVLGEMTEQKRIEVAEKLWNAAEKMLLIVEPGTPVGYANLMMIRRALLDLGAHIAAPCPCEGDCPLPPDDWCGFTCRVQRTRIHRRLKGGDAPFEDEKFSYVAFTREAVDSARQRVLRHPQIYSGYVELRLCTADGIEDRTVTKKDGELYRHARKADAGDAL